MAYSTKTDLVNAMGGPDRLDEAADIDGDGVADDAVVTDVIAEADATIDSYCRLRYKVPFLAPSLLVTKKSASLAKLILRERRGAFTERDEVERDAIMKWLDDVGKGIASPAADPVPEKSTAVVPKTIDRDPDEFEVSRENLKGYS